MPTGANGGGSPQGLQPGPIAPPQPGEGIGSIQIEAIQLDDVVVEGVGADQLKSGVGHFPGTPWPGQLGNVVIAGHRTAFGAPFLNLDTLVPGDTVLVATVDGRFVYRVTNSSIQDPAHTTVVDTPGTATLTLIAPDPKMAARQRLVVTAELDPAASSPILGAASAGSWPSDFSVPWSTP